MSTMVPGTGHPTIPPPSLPPAKRPWRKRPWPLAAVVTAAAAIVTLIIVSVLTAIGSNTGVKPASHARSAPPAASRPARPSQVPTQASSTGPATPPPAHSLAAQVGAIYTTFSATVGKNTNTIAEADTVGQFGASLGKLFPSNPGLSSTANGRDIGALIGDGEALAIALNQGSTGQAYAIWIAGMTKVANDFGIPPATYGSSPTAPAIVRQFYQEINNRDFADAWNLGGVDIAGTTYRNWVAGYATTAHVTLLSVIADNGTVVHVHFVSTLQNGTLRTYGGTYTVIDGVIVSASISQPG